MGDAAVQIALVHGQSFACTEVLYKAVNLWVIPLLFIVIYYFFVLRYEVVLGM